MLIWIFFLVNSTCLFTTVSITLTPPRPNCSQLCTQHQLCLFSVPLLTLSLLPGMSLSSPTTLSPGSLLLILKIQTRPISCREFFLITFRLSQFTKNCHWFRMDIRPVLAQPYKGRTFSPWLTKLFSLVLSCWGLVKEAGSLISSDSHSGWK